MVGGLQPPPEEDEAAAAEAGKQGVVFVLENANLETGKVGKGFALLNCDDHANFLRKNGKDVSHYRPDICHQALLAILDSPLNKAGKLKGLYIHTSKNVLIQVNPQVRIPRTFKRFSGLMLQLLQKLSIRSTNGPDKLLKVVKGPVTKYFPPNARRVGFSYSSPDVVKLADFVRELPEDVPAVFVVGAFAHGKIDTSYCDQMVSVSEYPLSAAYCISRITNAFEAKFDIV
mmetsp:Transcript_2604/g.6601  ORF Transcript_2604/g.6601 Transcript_2604/m.6601 type:complete len:230 (-) Transcript_2604:72-761(-)